MQTWSNFLQRVARSVYFHFPAILIRTRHIINPYRIACHRPLIGSKSKYGQRACHETKLLEFLYTRPFPSAKDRVSFRGYKRQTKLCSAPPVPSPQFHHGRAPSFHSLWTVCVGWRVG